ncbi:hypothetical protein O6H91_03G084700 [Diphasiastrum complanatum]|uniref:Uncharacterized protein n=1 Tax=Diphasiastrum complanatum TaxID=34168 RepID=A0ACC2E849_DIPCM|nr:hypothetical protein O6H91_03G084700 [Diphasiastrum complanatum]
MGKHTIGLVFLLVSQLSVVAQGYSGGTLTCSSKRYSTYDPICQAIDTLVQELIDTTAPNVPNKRSTQTYFERPVFHGEGNCYIEECNECLNNLWSVITTDCGCSVAAQTHLHGSCNIHYDIRPF